ncbi:protein hook [Anopheles ziemanni]|uniref:protein hook n=1 Tax=Anopheles coustani TaxID=139045 RepID=UPI0026595358|nr:protein hook [Anopheles coustani]XP_058168552.1 protein hook [Anopheles ziemanni]
MESDKMEIYESLVRWLSVLNLSAPHETVQQLSDGAALAQALNQIAPEVFTDGWLSKIKSDVGANWRLKVSNLRKIIEGIYVYYQDELSLNLSEELRPDALKIAEKCDAYELGRLLQLILGCAVNCLEKQKYITQIMELEESLQRNIMAALQDIEYIWQGASPSRNSINTTSSLDVKTLQEDRDTLAQKCHETNKKMLVLIEEKSALQQEIVKLQAIVGRYENPNLIGDDGTSLGPIQLGSSRYNELRKLVDSLKDELLQAETARDDLKMKSMIQEKEIGELHVKIDELHTATAEIAQLKDEIDILKEANEKLKICESQLQTYKKKLEDYNDLRKQMKLQEERSSEYLKQNLQYEEEAKKYAGLKGQVELYKKEIQDMHAKLDVEMGKTVKAEFDFNQLQVELAAVQREKEHLLSERDSLREAFDELKCGQAIGADGAGHGGGAGGNTMSKELHSNDLHERIERLERENKALREGQGGQTALSQLLDDSNQRNEKLREQLKAANQKILLLSQHHTDDGSSKSEMELQLKQTMDLGGEQRSSQIDEAHLSNLHTKIANLEAALAAKDQELQAADVRYKKCVEKAKEVIKTLDPHAISEALLMEKGHMASDPSSGTGVDGAPATASNTPHRPPMGQQEEQLIATAFYRLGMACHREAVDARLLSGPGQSFLARQRQPAARKPLNANFAKK